MSLFSSFLGQSALWPRKSSGLNPAWIISFSHFPRHFSIFPSLTLSRPLEAVLFPPVFLKVHFLFSLDVEPCHQSLCQFSTSRFNARSSALNTSSYTRHFDAMVSGAYITHFFAVDKPYCLILMMMLLDSV